MTAKQTRRTISLHDEDFDTLTKISAHMELPMSRVVTQLLDGSMPPAVGLKLRSTAAKGKGKAMVAPVEEPGYIVNLDMVVDAASPAEAKAKIEALIRGMKLKGSVIGVDEDANYEKAPTNRALVAKVG